MDDVASTGGAAWEVGPMLSLPEQSVVTFEVPIPSRFYDIPSATAREKKTRSIRLLGRIIRRRMGTEVVLLERDGRVLCPRVTE